MEEHKIEIVPYLSFQGNCEEAVHTYMDAFGSRARADKETAGSIKPA